MTSGPIYLGIDCGATTSKVCGIDATGSILSRELRQSPTNSQLGPDAIVEGWISGAEAFIESIGHSWQDLGGVGLAMPGPYLAYGVLGQMPNMSSKLTGWHFLDDLQAAIARKTGRDIPAATANDGLLAGVAEARLIQPSEPGSVFMLAPGSGLGCSFVDADGKLLAGDHQAGVILCHMPAPYERLGLPRFTCGCGRDWGCFEAYTAISGLPQYLDHFLPDFPDHPLARSQEPPKQKALSLRGLAQDGDELALAIFDRQAQAMGYAVATGCMAYDPTHIVIGGGLVDPEATTPAFRKRYMDRIRESAAEYLWINPDQLTYRAAALGELSQAIGAAYLVASSGNGIGCT